MSDLSPAEFAAEWGDDCPRWSRWFVATDGFGQWYADRPDGLTVLTYMCEEDDYWRRVGGWVTMVFYPDVIDAGGDTEIAWLHLSIEEADIGFQMATALLASDWTGGEVPDSEVDVTLSRPRPPRPRFTVITTEGHRTIRMRERTAS